MSEQTSPVPETIGPARRSRGGVVAVVLSVVAVLVVGGGGFAAWRFLAGGGPRPAEVLPASTFALLSIDLDPSGGQKIEAIKTLRKFPSFREHTGVRPDSDIVKAIWDETLGQACTKIDYAHDVKPWIGQRAALGGVEIDKGKPTPVVVVQVSDKDKATQGLDKILDCAKASGDDDYGFTVGDDYAVVSDSTAHAKAIVAAGKTSPLSQDASYQKWTDAAGGPGIANGYVSHRGAELLSQQLTGALGSAAAQDRQQLSTTLEKFTGAGASLKFNDGGLELSLAGGGIDKVGVADVGEHVAALPKDTAAVLAGAVDGDKAADWIDQALSGRAGMFGGGDQGALKSTIEKRTGLRLPGDIATLLGRSFSLSVGADAPADLSKIQAPSDVPAGYLVRGDEQAVRDVVDRVQARTGFKLSDIPATFDTAKGKAVLATTPDYAKQLLSNGSLGNDATFKSAVPHAAESPFVLYLSLDNAWSASLAKAARGTGEKSDDEVAEDLEALKAVGASAWNDGSTGHALVRVTAK